MSLRIAVVGVAISGVIMPGILHPSRRRALAAVDVNGPRAQDIAAQCGTTALTDCRDLIGRVDAVTVAVPTQAHSDVVGLCLSSGMSVLVEKPMARTLAEADAMIGAAAQHGVTLAVGHTERFNPAVEVARPLLTDPRFIEVHRLGTFPGRSLDIDVVFDLMIHDSTSCCRS